MSLTLDQITNDVSDGINQLITLAKDVGNATSSSVATLVNDISDVSADVSAIGSTYAQQVTAAVQNDASTYFANATALGDPDTIDLNNLSNAIQSDFEVLEGYYSDLTSNTQPAPAAPVTADNASTADSLLTAIGQDYIALTANIANAANQLPGQALPTPVSPGQLALTQSPNLSSSTLAALASAAGAISNTSNTVNETSSTTAAQAAATSGLFSQLESNLLSSAQLLGQAAGNFITNAIINPVSIWLAQVANYFSFTLFGTGDAPGSGSWSSQITAIPLPSVTNTADHYIASLNQVINAPKGLLDWFGSLAIRIATASSALGAAILPYINLVEQEAQAANPTELIATNDLIDGVYKQTISQAIAQSTANKQGISSPDFITLFNNAAYTPDIATAAMWLARGFITAEQYSVIATANRLSPAYADTVYQGSFRPVSAGSRTGLLGRLQAFAQGFLPSINSLTPDTETLSLYAAQQIPADQATLDFIAHYTIPGPDWFAQAGYRGIRNVSDVALAATAANYPPDIAAQYQDVIRPMIPVRVVTTLLSQKIIPLATAQAYYAQLGYSAQDVATLVQYAESLAVRIPKTAPQDLTRLALSDANGLFVDGTITALQLTSIYEAHGYTADAAADAVQFVTLKQTAANRKAYAEELVEQVDLQQITIATAVSTLFSSGYTQAEVLKYEKIMKRAAAKKIKEPTQAEVVKMVVAGILPTPALEAYFVSNNFDSAYIPYLVQLYTPTPATPDTSVQ